MRRHPLLVLDSREKYVPVAVEAVQDAARIGRQRPKVDDLPPSGGKLDFPPDPEAWAPAVQANHGGVGYARELVVGRHTCVQYWMFYLDNPKAWGGYGRHEGDWETVHVWYVKDIPFAVMCSQHHGGEARFWWDVQTRPGVPPNVLRPVIYVARDSHANYFEPVRGSIADDVCDGRGQVLDLEWREFGPWATWPGRWGNSSGVGESPQSPGCQIERWRTPQHFMSRAR